MKAIITFNVIAVKKGVKKMPTDEEIKKVLTEELSYILDSDVIIEKVSVSYIKGGDTE